MKFSQLAAQRYSVRRFDSRPVEQAVLDQILETGRLAPTAKNLQPQRIYVVRSEVLLAKLRAITAMTFARIRAKPGLIRSTAAVQRKWTRQSLPHT